MMKELRDQLERHFYPEFSSNWDDQMFRECILRHIKPESEVLDIGAGAGIVSQMNFKGRARRVCGVDLDPRVTKNPFLDEGRVADASHIPYEDASFDVVFADNVLEHLAAPLQVFSEVRRVLRESGVFLVKTPNKYHYVPLIASLTPHRFHQWINRRRGRESDDTFPTLYRANTEARVREVGAEAGFDRVETQLFEGRPEYLRGNIITYVPGLAYERLVNSSELFRSGRVLLIAELFMKPGA